MNKRNDNINSHSGKTSAWLIPRRTSDFSVSTLKKNETHNIIIIEAQVLFVFRTKLLQRSQNSHLRFFIITAYANEKMLIGANKKRAQLDSFVHMLHQLDKLQLDENLCQHPQYRTGQKKKLFSEVHGRVVSGKAHLSRRLSAAWTDDRNLSPWLIVWLVWMVWLCISRQIFVNWISSRLNISLFFRHETN